jgi:hypothetical protein
MTYEKGSPFVCDMEHVIGCLVSRNARESSFMDILIFEKETFTLCRNVGY